METNKTSRLTNSGVENIRASRQDACLSFVATLASNLRSVPNVAQKSEAREVEGLPALGLLLALRSHGSCVDQVYYSCQYVHMGICRLAAGDGVELCSTHTARPEGRGLSPHFGNSGLD